MNLYLSVGVTTLYNVWSVHRGVFSTSGGYHEYIAGGISWVNWEMFSTLEGYQDECGRYHEYIRGCSVHRRDIMHEYNDWCLVHVSWYPPLYWTCPDVLMISPAVIMVSPDVLNIPRYTHGIPRMYWTPPTNVLMISPDVLMVSPNVLLVSLNCSHGIPRCTEQPPMYWKSNDVLKTHYTGWWLHHNQTEVMMFSNTKAL